jgi:hypothetical protein
MDMVLKKIKKEKKEEICKNQTLVIHVAGMYATNSDISDNMTKCALKSLSTYSEETARQNCVLQRNC